jgi:ribonucleoside-diphosphate reductase alpha chain
VSKVRAAGTPLKTFGGRASGPEPLVDLFHFTIKIFKAAQGRKLNTLECHDLMCKIGEVVVVGGVRRSAMISLSDLNDERIRHAKSGNWWETAGHRALANNSAVYDVKPTVGTFLEEWTSLYNSHSGERGIFNREAAKAAVAKYGKRDPNYEFGTNPCSEIILRPYQFCNLTEVMVRPEDTLDSLKQKVRMAAILGTIQATFTHFPYLRKVWQRNTEEERLLGVSLTGIYDHKVMSNTSGAELWLPQLRLVAEEANAEFADLLGIPRSTAITAVKPSGTVSQLTDTASGIHPRHSPYYIRRVRGDMKDPLSQFLVAQGIPNEPCVMKPNNTIVFSFPQKAPEGLTTRDDIDAIDHLGLWLTYQRHWCEHKPSVTISVKESEWPKVGAFVWDHFDEMSGVSFLPHDGGTYRQAPYEECTKEDYDQLLAQMPTINWAAFAENTDNVEGAQTLACTAGGCEI